MSERVKFALKLAKHLNAPIARTQKEYAKILKRAKDGEIIFFIEGD